MCLGNAINISSVKCCIHLCFFHEHYSFHLPESQRVSNLVVRASFIYQFVPIYFVLFYTYVIFLLIQDHAVVICAVTKRQKIVATR